MNAIDIFAWIVAVFVAFGTMPGRIARRRGHPWPKAVAVGSWATLICGFVFWPLVLVWANVAMPERREPPR